MKNLSSNQATKSYKLHTPNYWSDNEAELYGDMERYGIISGSLGLAKEIAERIALPIGNHVATKIIVPIGDHVIKEVMVPVGKHVIKDIALPVAKYIVKEVSVEIKDLTTKLMKSLTEQIKEAVKQEIDVMQSKIKALPSEIIEGVKSSINIKLPWKAPTMEISDDDDYDSYTYNTYSCLEI